MVNFIGKFSIHIEMTKIYQFAEKTIFHQVERMCVPTTASAAFAKVSVRREITTRRKLRGLFTVKREYGKVMACFTHSASK